jgi:hypothetical protein
VQSGAIVNGLWKDAIEIRLILMILNLVEQAEHLVPLHALYHVRVRADVPVEEVYGCTEQLLLQSAEALRGLTIPRYRGGAQAVARISIS